MIMEIFSPGHACIYLTMDGRPHYDDIDSSGDLFFFFFKRRRTLIKGSKCSTIHGSGLLAPVNIINYDLRSTRASSNKRQLHFVILTYKGSTLRSLDTLNYGGMKKIFL